MAEFLSSTENGDNNRVSLLERHSPIELFDNDGNSMSVLSDSVTHVRLLTLEMW